MTRDLTRMVHTIPSTWSRWKGTLRRATYLLVLFLLIAFLADLGAEPWLHALENWPTFLVLILTTGTGLVIQARAFSAVSTGPTPPHLEMLRIWSASAVVSVVAPLFAGIATRTTLLVQQGMSISNCLSASLRQVWMGVEYALLAAALSLPITEWPGASAAAISAFITWLVSLALRTGVLKTINRGKLPAKIGQLLTAINQPIPPKAHMWFAFQVLAMTATYYVGFNWLGADLTFASALALSSLTILMSLLVFVPNGLGVTDALWVFVATEKGLTIEQAVAVAIMIRMSHLAGAAILYLLSNITKPTNIAE